MKSDGLWPGYDSGPIKNDPRRWCAIHGWLFRRGISLDALCKELGKAEAPELTDEYLRTIVLAYKAKHGRWPATNSRETIEGDGRTWAGVYNSTKGVSGSRFRQILKEFKSEPPDWTHEYARSLIEAFYKRTRTWPIGNRTLIEGDGRTWGSLASWLSRNGSSFLAVCESLGRPVQPPFTLEYAKKLILEHKTRTGTWPSKMDPIEGDGRSWHALEEYVKRNFGPRWGDLCKELGKSGYNAWTKGAIEAEVRAYVSKHDKWPSASNKDGPWNSASQWLVKNEGLTLYQLTLQMGRRDHPSPPPVPEETLRQRIQGLSVQEYRRYRKEWGPGWPYPHEFPNIYGKTFKHIQRGKPRVGGWVDIETVQRVVQGLTTKAYDDLRQELGPTYPSSRHFERIYGKSFQEVRDGHHRAA